jgi:hypothetical protein
MLDQVVGPAEARRPHWETLYRVRRNEFRAELFLSAAILPILSSG